jgi:ribosomal protein L11 methylase PrmA
MHREQSGTLILVSNILFYDLFNVMTINIMTLFQDSGIVILAGIGESTDDQVPTVINLRPKEFFDNFCSPILGKV